MLWLIIVRQENEIQETCIRKGNAIFIFIVDFMTDKVTLPVVVAKFFNDIDYNNISQCHLIQWYDSGHNILQESIYTLKTEILKRVKSV